MAMPPAASAGGVYFELDEHMLDGGAGMVRSSAWAVVGAVIGAGFASGREVAAFFSRYGAWSWFAVSAAVAAIAWVSLGTMRSPGVPVPWRHRWPGRVWQGMFIALMATTGGAMLAGAGEIAALTLPLHGAYWMGMLSTLCLAWWLSERRLTGLALLSQILTACLLVAMAMGLSLPRIRGVWVEDLPDWSQLPSSLLHGLCYGGFNVALASPVMDEMAEGLSSKQKRRCVALVCLILGAVLSLGNAVLLRHPALLGAALPYVELLGMWGRWGMLLGALALYLAVLTTLVACLRGLKKLLKRRWSLCLPIGVALLGFAGAVDGLYPLLGGGCFLLLAAKALHKEPPPG